MAEWLYEDGVGERRAALVDGGTIIAARIERDSDGARPGAVLPARLLPAAGRGPRLMRLDGGEEALLTALPPQATDGAAMLVEITRTAIPEERLTKRAVARPAQPGASAVPGPTLRDRIAAEGQPVRVLRAFEADELEAAGWSEWCEGASSGDIAFPGGMLRIALTPAMTVIDIDGDLPPAALADAGARAAARAIHALDIGGSIAIDLPTTANRAERVAVAEAFDAAMAPHIFERTAINGFGLLHVVRPRVRRSLPEYLRFAPVESAALALLRRAERARAAMLTAHPLVTEWIAARPALIGELERRTGRALALHPDADRPIGGGDAG